MKKRKGDVMDFVLKMLREGKNVQALKKEVFLKGEKVERAERILEDGIDAVFTLHENMMVGWGAYGK